MSNKRFDFSVLPDGFLIEALRPVLLNSKYVFRFDGMDGFFRTYPHAPKFRPALNHWHFNDGSIVLPDGLVFIAKDLTGYEFTSATPYPFQYDREDPLGSIVGVRIVGAHPDYAINAKELGIEVIEI